MVIPAATGLLPLAARTHQDVAQGFRHVLACGPGAFALQLGDVEAAKVLRLERAHGKTVGAHRRVDGGDGGAQADEGFRLGTVALQDAVADEAVGMREALGDQAGV
jgi:hypothetical protein